MSMIAGGDQSARNAFLTNLRDDSSRRVIDTSRANPTQELDPSDILEVKDLANAIERAERSMLTPLPVPAQYSRALDMFEALGSSDPGDVATDDTAGSALYAPVIPTPVPPALAAAARTTPIPPPPATFRSADLQKPTPAPAPVIYVPTEDDAFLQPAPRIRSLADESLQIHRPEPTLLVRAGVRRRKATTVVGIVFGLAALFMGGAFAANELSARANAAAPTVSTTTIATATFAKPTPPAPAAKPEAKPETKAEAKPAPAKAEAKPAEAKPAVPTFDVKNLPSAKRR